MDSNVQTFIYLSEGWNWDKQVFLMCEEAGAYCQNLVISDMLYNFIPVLRALFYREKEMSMQAGVKVFENDVEVTFTFSQECLKRGAWSDKKLFVTGNICYQVFRVKDSTINVPLYQVGCGQDRGFMVKVKQPDTKTVVFTMEQKKELKTFLKGYLNFISLTNTNVAKTLGLNTDISFYGEYTVNEFVNEFVYHAGINGAFAGLENKLSEVKAWLKSLLGTNVTTRATMQGNRMWFKAVCTPVSRIE